MAQATPKKHVSPQLFSHLWRGLREVSLWSSALIALYLGVALLTYSPQDPSWSYSAESGPVNNAGGVVGAYIADALFTLLGWLAYAIPVVLVYGGWSIYREHREQEMERERPSKGLLLMRAVGALLLLPSATGLLAMHGSVDGGFAPGGLLGDSFNQVLVAWFSTFGASLLLLALFVSGVTLLTGLSWFWVMDVLGALTLKLTGLLWNGGQRLSGRRASDDDQDRRAHDVANPADEDGRTVAAAIRQRLAGLRPAWAGGGRSAEPAVAMDPEERPPAVQKEIQFGDGFGIRPEQPVKGFESIPPVQPTPGPVADADFARSSQVPPPWSPPPPVDAPWTTQAAPMVAEDASVEPLSMGEIYVEPRADRLGSGHRPQVADELSTDSEAAAQQSGDGTPHQQPSADPDEAYASQAEQVRQEPVIHFPSEPPAADTDEPVLTGTPLAGLSGDRPVVSESRDESLYPPLFFDPPAASSAAEPVSTSESVAAFSRGTPPSPAQHADSASTTLTRSAPEPQPDPRPVAAGQAGLDTAGLTPPAPWTPPVNTPAPFPSLSLLDPSDDSGPAYTREALEHLSRLLEEKLGDFRIKVQVVAVHPGPVITRFELLPAPGIKVSRITNLSKDIARSLSVTRVRVVEVIPGKATIGLEIPNHKRETVRLSEIFSSPQYDHSHSPLTLALGKDIGGKPVVVDLAKMPHLLVAGTTGSGKSVSVNAMILSLLYKARAHEVRLIMIDPKMLELSIYDGIPHLLAPVVTDMKEAAHALRWCVVEMERRYQLMAAMGVRNLKGYNLKIQAAIDSGNPIIDPTVTAEQGPVAYLEPLPFIVVVVDELADLMMVVGKKIEELIARLAQKARAAGVHLILATQRPSVDVITGLIKANIPTRIAFQVSSKVDSRTILDQGGAEALLGMGDMLYLPPGTGIPMRVHGAFVDDHEVHNVVEQLKATGETDYLEGLLEEGGTEVPEGVVVPGDPVRPQDETDALYDQAVRIVTETRRASVSGVQRRLRIGYNRAARLVESMEAAGVVGPLQPNGSREVLAPPPVEV